MLKIIPKSICGFLSCFLLIFLTAPSNGRDDNGRHITLWTTFKHPIKFGHLSVEDGLSQSSVLAICQDRKGFTWFGTEDGLNRFDGYNFTIYRPEPGNPHSLSYNIVFALAEDSRGELWIGTNGGGLDRFDRDLERFIHYRHDPRNPSSISDNLINCIVEDRSGRLWIGTNRGVNEMVREGETVRFIRYEHDPSNSGSLSDNAVNDIFEDQKGNLWIATENGGLNRLISNRNGGEKTPPVFIRYSVPSESPGIEKFPENNAMSVNEDHTGTLWVGTKNGLYRFDEKQEKPVRCFSNRDDPFSLSHDYIRLIYKDRAGVLWIGTDGGGLNKLVPADKPGLPPIFVRYRYNPNSLVGLHNNAVESIFEDRQGVLWIGLYRGGIDKLLLKEATGFNRENEMFIHYHNIPNNPVSLSNNAVNAILEDSKGVLWVGTDGGGLNKIFPDERNVGTLKFVRYQNEPARPDSLSDNIVTCLHEDRQGILWVGTYTGGVNRLERGEGKRGRFTRFKTIPGDISSLGNNFVMSIFEDSMGNLWLGTIGGGLDRFDRKTGTFTHYRSRASDPFSLSEDDVMCIYEDRFQRLWIGTIGGGNLMDRISGKFKRYVHVPGAPRSLNNNFVRVIYQDQSGVLWIGTNGGGLNRFSGKNNNPAPSHLDFIHYEEKDGLPSNVILGILEDKQGNLWLSTVKGLSQFNPQSGVFKNYDTRDGLQSDEFNRGAYWKSRSGEMFFGGNNGFNVFDPGGIRENTHIPTIVVTGFQVLNQPVLIGSKRDGRVLLDRSITETQSLVLSHRDAVFSFEFAALHYVNPSKNRYAYKMEGLDKAWNDVGNRHFVSFTTLPPGDYVFRVKGSNSDGVWNEEGVSIRIKVLPPFWKTWWFYALVVLLVVLVMVGIHLYRVRQIILREQRKYEKTHISTSKSDEYLTALLDFIRIEKPYLQPDLTIQKLSQMVSIPHHYLSQVINTRFNKIFFDFINDYRIEEAVRKLANPVECQKSIPQIAKEVGFNSQSAFNRAFKKNTQKTPSDFINEYRIEEARKKLTDPDEKKKSIQQVAIEVGFPSQAAFNRLFRKLTHLTPSQYRKANSNRGIKE